MREIVHVQAGQCGNQVRVGQRCGVGSEKRAQELVASFEEQVEPALVGKLHYEYQYLQRRRRCCQEREGDRESRRAGPPPVHGYAQRWIGSCGVCAGQSASVEALLICRLVDYSRMLPDSRAAQ